MGRLNRTVNLVVALMLAGLVLAVMPSVSNLAVGAQDAARESGRPEAFPAEIVVGDRDFLFDRLVPFGSEGLVEIGAQDDVVVFAESTAEPFDRVFVAVPGASEALARYLPQLPLGPDGLPLAANACLSQPPEFGDLDTGEGVYAYAGPEDDIPLNDLITLATTDEGYTVYADPEQQPSPELLVDTGAEVFRFVLLDEQGRPPVLGDELRFGGTTFAFEGNQADAVDPAALVPVGCAGPFPLSAPVEQADSGAITQLYATVDDRLFAYRAVEATPAEGQEPLDGETAAADESTLAPDAAATPPAAETGVIATEAPATVPAEEPAVGEPPATAPAPDVTEEPGAEPSDALPLAVTLDGTRFALDRVVPLDLQTLEPAGEDAGVQLFAAPGGPPYERVYGARDAAAASAGRYLAQLPVNPEGTCLAETANFTLLTVGEDRYAYAGPEPDLVPDQLQTVFETADGQPVYAETADGPFPELYVLTEGVLSRFVLLDERGVPVTIGDAIAFGGQEFVFARDATGEVDVTALNRLGCVGPFPVRSAQDADAGPFAEIFVVLNDDAPRALAFVAADVATEPATPPAVPTVAPAEPTIEAPTEVPTATPVPPTATPVPPTATPIPPTATPAPPPATPTPEPAPATQIPATALPAETPTPETAPSPAPGTPQPPSDAAPTPLVLPTVAPQDAPSSAIPIDAPAPVPETLPREILVQGIRYLFDLEVDVDPQSLVQVDVVQTPETTLTIFAAPEDQIATARLSYRQGDLLGPFGRVYAVSAATGIVVRYVSEAPVTTAGTVEIAAPCSAEAAAQTFSYTFESQQYAYTFASVETNLSVEALRVSTETALGEIPVADDGREILVRAGGYPGLAEIFLAGDEGLDRYIALNEAGVPVTLNNLIFAETRFRYEAQVSVEITESAFRRIGCAGPFPLFAPIAQAEAAAPLQAAFTVIDARVYQFVAIDIVVAPTGQVPAPPAIVPPPPGYVQISLETTVVVGPTPTPLPNIRVIPLPGLTPTPASGLATDLPLERRRCQGDPGPIGANGLPERLPARIQLSGIAYGFVRAEQTANDLRLRRVGCVGPFEAVQAEGTGGRVVFLRTDRATQTIYRYETATSFAVDFVAGGDPRVITAGDERFVLAETWERSVYSSVTVIVYAQDADAADPPRIFAVQVDGDVIAEYVPEGGDVVEASPALRARAAEVNINPDLILGGGRRYLLMNLWTPVGTTTNGWVTLYAPDGAAGPDTLLATDPRSLALFVYRG